MIHLRGVCRGGGRMCPSGAGVGLQTSDVADQRINGRYFFNQLTKGYLDAKPLFEFLAKLNQEERVKPKLHEGRIPIKVSDLIARAFTQQTGEAGFDLGKLWMKAVHGLN